MFYHTLHGPYLISRDCHVSRNGVSDRSDSKTRSGTRSTTEDRLFPRQLHEFGDTVHLPFSIRGPTNGNIFIYMYISPCTYVCVYERACCARLRACIYVSVDVETSNGIMRPCLASNITAQFSTITVTAQGKIVVKKLITVRSKRERITSLYR